MRSVILLTAYSLFCAVAALAQSAPAGGESLDIPKLIENALGNGRAAKLLSEYAYTMRMAQRKADRKGRITEESETYEAYFPTLKRKGETKFVLIKTKENDRPVAPERLERERQKATERLLKGEEEAQKVDNSRADEKGGKSAEWQDAGEDSGKNIGIYFRMNAGTMFSGVSLDVRTLLKNCDFDSPRHEVIDGREAIALNFRPRPGASFEKEQRYLAQSVGTVWIDAADKILVRVEGWPRAAPTRAGNPAFVYEQVRLPDGHWLPRLGRMNCASHPTLFGANYDFVFEFGNYQHFYSEIKDVRINKPAARP